MELKVTQCSVGKYNWAGNEKSLSFYMGIYDNDKLVEVDGIKALLHYSGEENELDDFRDAIDNLEYAYEKCLKYADKVISSVDYEAQCLTFIKVYTDNFELINETQKTKERISIEKRIQKLQKELENISDLPANLYETTNSFIRKKINQYKKWQEPYIKELPQIIEGTEKHIEVTKKINDYQQKIGKLTEKLIP